MQENNPPAPGASSAFEIVTPSKSKKTNFKSIIIILLVFVFLGGAIFLGVTLVRQNQNITEKATGNQCPAAEACPASGGTLLRNCTPPESDNSPADSVCDASQIKRIEACGGTQYCCNGSAWTTNMSACATATASPTATATASPIASPTIEPLVTQSPTPTLTLTPTPTATATTTSSIATVGSTSTPIPIPSTGTGWPTYLGAGVGIVVIIASILLAI